MSRLEQSPLRDLSVLDVSRRKVHDGSHRSHHLSTVDVTPVSTSILQTFFPRPTPRDSSGVFPHSDLGVFSSRRLLSSLHDQFWVTSGVSYSVCFVLEVNENLII